MSEIGYWLSGEEHDPNDLIRNARRAEEMGFTAAFISDHYHPWIERQGHSPFVWTVIGGIAHATERLRLGTGVTCPIMRIHPAIIAQAAATAAVMMPGRFFLGVGAGEKLNEHILGDHWPPPNIRLEMLEEAVQVIRLLWRGGFRSHRGRYYRVENARIYDLPDEPPPIIIAAGGPVATRLAARMGDGLLGVVPNAKQVKIFDESGGTGKPKYGKVTACWAKDEATARRTAHELWPSATLAQSGLELPLPAHFEELARTISEEDVAKAILCSPDPELHADKIREYFQAGYDHVFVHQVGPDQEGFFRFFKRQVLPMLGLPHER